MVNKENVMRLAKAFATQELATREVDPIGYCQSSWVTDVPKAQKEMERDYKDFSGHECGTTACVAGWAVAVLGKQEVWDKERKRMERQGFYRPFFHDLSHGDQEHIRTEAKKLLGLDEKQASALFDFPEPVSAVKDEQLATCTVAATLKHLAETGEVNWNKGALKAREANGQVG